MRSTDSRRPFSPIDEIGCHFDSSEAPNNVHLEACVPKRLEVGRLRQSIASVLAEHPHSRARRGSWRWSDRTFAWEIPPTLDLDPLIVVEPPAGSSSDTVRSTILSAVPPVDRSPPVRFWLVRSPQGGDSLVLNAHHAALDGVSCLGLLRAVASTYKGTSDPPLPGSLSDEPHVAPRPVRTMSGAVSKAGIASQALRPLVHRPARLAPEGASSEPGYGVCSVRLSRQETTLIARRRPFAGATVNDVLIAALHLAVESWNVKHDRDCDTVVTSLSLNDRGASNSDSLGNLSRLAQVSTRASQRAGHQELVSTVVRQTRTAKASRTPHPAGIASAVLGAPRLPVSAKQLLTRPLLRLGRPLVDTTLLTNLGRVGTPLAFGEDNEAECVWFSTSAAMPRGLSLGAITAAERLHLSFRYRHALLSTEGASRFSTIYLGALRGLVEQASYLSTAD